MSNIKLEIGKKYLDGFNNIIEINGSYKSQSTLLSYYLHSEELNLCSIKNGVEVFSAKNHVGFEYGINGKNLIERISSIELYAKPYDQRFDIIKEYTGDEESNEVYDINARRFELNKLKVINDNLERNTSISIPIPNLYNIIQSNRQ